MLYSTYMCFAAIVAGRNISIKKYFNLVDAIEYQDKELTFANLEYLTKQDRKIEGSKIDEYEKEFLRMFPSLKDIPKLKE